MNNIRKSLPNVSFTRVKTLVYIDLNINWPTIEIFVPKLLVRYLREHDLFDASKSHWFRVLLANPTHSRHVFDSCENGETKKIDFPRNSNDSPYRILYWSRLRISWQSSITNGRYNFFILVYFRVQLRLSVITIYT